MATVQKSAARQTRQRTAAAAKIVPDYELIESDGEPLDSAWHRDAIGLLIDVVSWQFRHRSDFYVGGNMFIYFSPKRSRQRDYRGPDFFFVDGVPRYPQRLYWAVWEEGDRFPDFLLELLSKSTAKVDRTTKKRIYEGTFRTHEYCMYDPDKKKLEGFRLDARGRYRPIEPNENGWLWIEKLELWLGLWEGKYLASEGTWPRFYDRDGRLIPTRAEAAEAEVERLKARLAKREGNNRNS